GSSRARSPRSGRIGRSRRRPGAPAKRKFRLHCRDALCRVSDGRERSITEDTMEIPSPMPPEMLPSEPMPTAEPVSRPARPARPAKAKKRAAPKKRSRPKTKAKAKGRAKARKAKARGGKKKAKKGGRARKRGRR